MLAVSCSDTCDLRITARPNTHTIGNHVADCQSYNESGRLISALHTLASADGLSTTNSYDDNGDGVSDRIQSIRTTVAADGSRTETLTDKAGSSEASAVLTDRQVKTTSADGKLITSNRDTQGAGWFDSSKTRNANADGTHSIIIKRLAQNSSVISQTSSVVSVDGFTRTDFTDADGNGAFDTISTDAIAYANDARADITTLRNADGSLRSSISETIAADVKSKATAYDYNGDGVFDLQKASSFAVDIDRMISGAFFFYSQRQSLAACRSSENKMQWRVIQ